MHPIFKQSLKDWTQISSQTKSVQIAQIFCFLELKLEIYISSNKDT